MSSKLKNCFHNWLNVTNVYEVIRPFYYVAKFYGLAPFQLNRRHPYRQGCATNIIDFIIILFNFCGYLYIIHIMHNLEMTITEEHVFVTTSRGVLLSITNSMSIVFMVTNFFYRKDLQKVVNEINRIDREVRHNWRHHFGCVIYEWI